MNGEPYTALYTAALRLALRSMDDRLLRLFIALSTYADARGVCFPGVRELASATGFSVELVIELLYQLEEQCLLVYLRKNERDPVTKRQQPNVYMLTNQLYVAREAVDGVVFSSLDFVKKGTDFSQSLLENERKPDRKVLSFPIHNQNQEPNIKNQQYEPAAKPPPQPPTDPRNEGDAGSDSRAKEGKDKDKDEGKREGPPFSPQGETASAAQLNPSAAAQREPGDLAAYNTPLDLARERVAEEIRSLAGNMTHANARMLVDVYGAKNARAALLLYTLQPKGSIPNPAGYIRALLRKHAVSSEDIEPPGKASADLQEMSY